MLQDEIPGGALNLNQLTTRTMVTTGIFPCKEKIPMVEPGFFFLIFIMRLFKDLLTFLQVPHVLASVYSAECLSVSLLPSSHAHCISRNYSSNLLVCVMLFNLNYTARLLLCLRTSLTDTYSLTYPSAGTTLR